MNNKKGSPRDRERLEEALRANLHRRKAQIRGRKAHVRAEEPEATDTQVLHPPASPGVKPD